MSLLFVSDDLEVLFPIRTWVCRSANIYGCCTVEDARCHQDQGVTKLPKTDLRSTAMLKHAPNSYNGLVVQRKVPFSGPRAMFGCSSTA
jgi:hypothetical protein